MNIKDHFCLSRHLLPAIALYPTQQNRKCLHILNRQYTELHISNFFSPLGFNVQANSGHKTQKIKLYSVRALKCYLNEKNLIHGRVMETISKFSRQIFETYFNCSRNSSESTKAFEEMDIFVTFYLYSVGISRKY